MPQTECYLQWHSKPLLREIYHSFYKRIASYVQRTSQGPVVEIGSGIGAISDIIPDCIRTDAQPGPGIDRIENAYKLTFESGSLSNLILFDVLHHIRYPGNVLAEAKRVLTDAGRMIIFEPCISLLGRIVYGLFHREPLGLYDPIELFAPPDCPFDPADTYAAQGNPTRLFVRKEHPILLHGWRMVVCERLSAISYVASGGYSGPQLYCRRAYPLLRLLDAVLDAFPYLFATRLLVVLEKQIPGATQCA